MFASFVAACVEGWQELRIHKVRVLLSLVGVAVSITALTAAMGLGVMADQMVREAYEQMNGRPGTYTLSIVSEGTGGIDGDSVRGAVDEVLDRQEVEYATIIGGNMLVRDTRSEFGDVSGLVVDPDYAQIHSINTSAGRWFVDGDEENLSPSLVVNREMLTMLELGDADLPASVTLQSAGEPTVTVIGVADTADTYPGFYVLPQNASAIGDFSSGSGGYDMELWLPLDIGEELSAQLTSNLQQELSGFDVQMYRSDAFAQGDIAELDYVRYGMVGIAAVILLLSTLSLVNINVVTIQQRIREIGIRRSFGATSGRIFFSVVMESVVATALAGVVGVMIAIAILKSPWVTEWIGGLVSSVPPFPLGVAFLGVLVSVLTGVLAGVIPAVVATRVRIVDAIRA